MCKVFRIDFSGEEIECNQNIIDFMDFGKEFLGEFEASYINVNPIINDVQIFGKWHKNKYFTFDDGVIDVEFEGGVIEKLRNGDYKASEVLDLCWGNWYVHNFSE